MVIYCNMGQFGHVVAYVGASETNTSYWCIPGTLEA